MRSTARPVRPALVWSLSCLATPTHPAFPAAGRSLSQGLCQC
ncbi:hypothetical protein ACS15_0265 [Ralstonia insidiosa]|uniref:Uncharacterized protein n=1 Tax=Ralstonia insidiosa TaxID=190721 RepID=A0AAC9BH23_9RALS|nr:hypothetical protein ACS15_0265 [Ralstonia insidiosa]